MADSSHQSAHASSRTPAMTMSTTSLSGPSGAGAGSLG